MPAPDPARRSVRSREAILRAARDLIVETGFSLTTIEAIAARAGVGKQTIYRWWSSRSTVLFDAIVAVTEAGEDAAPLVDSGDLAADLSVVLRGIVDELKDPRTDALQRTVIAEIQHDEALAAALVDRVLRPQMQRVKQRLSTAQHAGQLDRAADLDLAVEQLVGPIFHRWLLRTRALTHRDADRLVTQTLPGLGYSAKTSHSLPSGS